MEVLTETFSSQINQSPVVDKDSQIYLFGGKSYALRPGEQGGWASDRTKKKRQVRLEEQPGAPHH